MTQRTIGITIRHQDVDSTEWCHKGWCTPSELGMVGHDDDMLASTQDGTIGHGFG